MGCNNSAPADKKSAGTAAPTSAVGKCEILGAPASMNCMAPILMAMHAGCGEMKQCVPGQDTQKPEFLEMNPLGGVPLLKDGDYVLSESSAILRYMALAYAPDLYPSDSQTRGIIDRAMDFWACNMYKDAMATVYPVFGYMPAPEDKAAAAETCMKNLEKFSKVFLKTKFVGTDKLSIADFKVAPYFFVYEHPALKNESLIECPARILQYNKDFKEACKSFAMMESAGGYSLKEMLDKKPDEPATMCAGSPDIKFQDFTLPKKGGKCEISGVTVSANCMGAVLLATHVGCGEMKQCMPGEDTQKPEFLEMNPLGGVPLLKDGEYILSESAAILRYMALTYAPDLYPDDPKVRGVIDRAMDFWACSMYADAITAIYPVLGFMPAPEDKAGPAQKVMAGLDKFATVFLKGKFVAGEQLSIADFKIAPFFFAYAHPALKKESLVDCPERIVQYCKDFEAACKTSSMLNSAGGWALKEVLDKKL